MSLQTKIVKQMKNSTAKKVSNIIIQIMNAFPVEDHKQSKRQATQREDICKPTKNQYPEYVNNSYRSLRKTQIAKLGSE